LWQNQNIEFKAIEGKKISDFMNGRMNIEQMNKEYRMLKLDGNSKAAGLACLLKKCKPQRR
jgi:hypothetical protein